MRYIKKINELFNSDIELNIVKQEDNEFKVEFELDSDLYFFQARQEELIFPESIRYGWHLGFGKGYGKDKYLPTGKNIPFKVLSAVNKSLVMFIDLYDPDKMSFISEGEVKTKLYLKLLEDLGYNITKEECNLDSLTGDTPYLFKVDKKN